MPGQIEGERECSCEWRTKLTFPKFLVNVMTISTMKIINEFDGKFTVFTIAFAFSRSLRIIALALVRLAIGFGLFARFFLALGTSLALCHHHQIVPKL